MKVKLLAPFPHDGMEYGAGSVLDLDPVYAQALIDGKRATSAEGKTGVEVSEPQGPTETATIKRRRSSGA